MMPPGLHRWFVETATPLSQALARDLQAAGPIWFPDRPDHGAAAYLARAIVGQQISAAAAQGIWRRVEAAAAARGETLAKLLEQADHEALRACGLSGPKVKAVRAVADAAAQGVFDDFPALSPAERAARLGAIWGVGPWTADMMAIFHYKEPDIWPAGDLAVVRVLKSYIGRRSPDRAAEKFAPHRSILALYMWRLARSPVVTMAK
jgi:DNA-3-methyladenine glycosylase II